MSFWLFQSRKTVPTFFPLWIRIPPKWPNLNLNTTCVTEWCFLFAALVIIPLAHVFGPLDVDLYAVLTSSLIIGFSCCPAGCLGCQGLHGTHPCPLVSHFSKANPVVWGMEGQYLVQVDNLTLILDGHHVGVMLPAPLTSNLPFHVGCVVMVCPGLDFYLAYWHIICIIPSWEHSNYSPTDSLKSAQILIQLAWV